MDFHVAVIASHGDDGRAAVKQAAHALAAARRAGLPVYHVVPHYRPDYPELTQRPIFEDVRQHGLFAEPHRGDGIAPELAPRPTEPICVKSRYSPFQSNDLLQMLRVACVEELVLCGIATRGVVLSALREAWDADYAVTILSDACADPDPDVHRMLIDILFRDQAEVQTVEQFKTLLVTHDKEG